MDPNNLVFVLEHLESTASTKHSISNGFIPKRLVDVGTGPDACPTLVTPEYSSDTKYATLSYCWGPPDDAAKQLKTTTANLEDHQKGLPQDAMPPIIRDAVVICRALGIRHIWIDALCIVQGSDGDWEEQSFQMCEIFGNSYLTICAAASRSCLEGILETRQPPSLTLGHASVGGLAVKGLYSLRPTPYESSPIQRYSIEAAAPLVQDLAFSAWTQRGWVYQEKCLSLRKLYFGKNQIHLQIGDVIFSENGCVEDIGRSDQHFHRDWPKNVTVGYLEQHGHVRNYWHDVVEQVALLQWTVRLDIFPSISGLAKRFKGFIDSPYLAGLWTDDLHYGLIWTPGEPTPISYEVTPSSRPDSLSDLLDELRSVSSQVAPSWSWASRRRGRCAFVIRTRKNAHLRREFDLLESRVQLENPANPFGRLRHASLHLSGRMIVPRIMEGRRRPGGDYHFFSPGRDGQMAEVFIDWGRRNIRRKEIEAEAQAPLVMFLISSCCVEPLLASDGDATPTDLRARSQSVYGPAYGQRLLNSEDVTGSNCRLCADQEAPRDIWGLLIHPTNCPGTYFRVGIFVSKADQGGMLLFEGSTRCTIELV